MALKSLIIACKDNDVVEWGVENGELTYTIRTKTEAEILADAVKADTDRWDRFWAKQRLEQAKKDEERELRSFHSTTTVAQLVQLLLKFPQDMKVGTFSPSDPNGPCTWVRPVLYEQNGQLRIDCNA